MGLYTLLVAGMTPPGALVTGLLADRWGIGSTLVVEAVICLTGLLIGVRFLTWTSGTTESSPAVTG